jgi:hypothetical protein
MCSELWNGTGCVGSSSDTKAVILCTKCTVIWTYTGGGSCLQSVRTSSVVAALEVSLVQFRKCRREKCSCRQCITYNIALLISISQAKYSTNIGRLWVIRVYWAIYILPTSRSHTHSRLSFRVVPDSMILVNKCLVIRPGQFATRLPAGAGGFLSSAQRLDPLWVASSQLFKGYRGS